MKYTTGEKYREKRGPRFWTVNKTSPSSGLYKVTDPDGASHWVSEAEFKDKVVKPRIPGVVYLSASQVSLFDRCPRKWGFKYIDGIKEPMRADPAFGIEGHDAIEQYLLTGEFPESTAQDVLVAARQGIQFLPDPDKYVSHTEQEFDTPILDGAARMVGFIDVVAVPREDGPVEVIDHKFTKNLRYAMTKKKMETDIQANTYAWQISKQFEQADVVTRWIYYGAKPVNGMRPREPVGSKKVETLKKKQDIEKNWNGILKLAEEMVELKKTAKTSEPCTPNPDACWDYGGCFYRNRCK